MKNELKSLAFVEASGDPGFASSGSSLFFTVACAIFNNTYAANACDYAIENLKKELGWSLTGSKSEFHFKRNTDQIRKKFLKTVAQHQFDYYCIIIKKNLCENKFKNKQELYNYACLRLLENARDKLENATIIADEDGGSDFGKQLGKHLKHNMNLKKQHVNIFKMQRSQSNNLIQLVDYIAGAITRSIAGTKKDANAFREIIKHREVSVELWP